MPPFSLPLKLKNPLLLLLVLSMYVQSAFGDLLDFSTNDTVTITAENAWEDEQKDVIHFSGQFELRAPDWSLLAESAIVYGKLDNPDKVVLMGNPAMVFFLRDTSKNQPGSPDENVTSSKLEEPNNSKLSIEGSATKIEYFRATNKLKMIGSATLKRKDNMLTSETIEYDVDTDKYSASGKGGINIQVMPKF